MSITDTQTTVARRVDSEGVTTLYFMEEEPPKVQLMPLVPGYGVDEVAYNDDDPRQLPLNIVLRFDPTTGNPTSISFPTSGAAGNEPWAWGDDTFKERLQALLGRPVFQAVAFVTDKVVGKKLGDEALLKWRAISNIKLGDYNHQTVNKALGLNTGWLGHLYA